MPTAAQIWRAYVTDGAPQSGVHKPVKSEIRAWGAAIEANRLTYGDVNQTIPTFVRLVSTSVDLTANRTWTLPLASTILPGAEMVIADSFGAVQGGFTLTVAPQGADTISGAASPIIDARYGFVRLFSDGASKWFTMADINSVYTDADGAPYTRNLFTRDQEILYLTDRIVSSEYAAIRNGTSTTDFTTHMQALITRLIANGVGGKIRLPECGRINFNSALLMPMVSQVKGMEIVGGGPGNTRVFSTSTTADMFTIGTVGAEWSQDLVFADFYVERAGTQTAGAFFNLRKTRRILIDNVRGYNGWKFMIAGEATDADSAQQTTLNNVRYIQVANQPIIDLVSGAIMAIRDGCKFDGATLSEHFLLKQSSTTRNWDGLRVGGVVCEQLGCLNLVGIGVSNSDFISGIYDRPNSRHVEVAPSAGGTAKNINWIGVRFQGASGANTLQGVRFVAGGRNVYDIKVQSCGFFDIGTQAIYTDDNLGYYHFIGNTIRDCGFDTGSQQLIRAGAGIKGIISHNFGYHVARPGYDYGIVWEGAAGDRKTDNNLFVGAATAAETGTP